MKFAQVHTFGDLVKRRLRCEIVFDKSNRPFYTLVILGLLLKIDIIHSALHILNIEFILPELINDSHPNLAK
jgi:hypothetical protein